MVVSVVIPTLQKGKLESGGQVTYPRLHGQAGWSQETGGKETCQEVLAVGQARRRLNWAPQWSGGDRWGKGPAGWNKRCYH